MNRLFTTRDLNELPPLMREFKNATEFIGGDYEWGVIDNRVCVWQNGDVIHSVPIADGCIAKLVSFMEDLNEQAIEEFDIA